MDYEIIYRRQAERQLDRLPQRLRRRIMDMIDGLPTEGDIKRLQGRAGFRLRVGGLRVLFKVDYELRAVYITDIRTRGDVYK